MADIKVKVSALTTATTLNGGDFLMLVQQGTSLKCDLNTLAQKLPSRVVVLEASEAPATGALATNKLVSKITITAVAAAYTLAAGTHGMEKQIVCSTAAGATPTAVVTVTSGVGVATLTFNALGDTALLKNVDGLWYVMATNSVAIA